MLHALIERDGVMLTSPSSCHKLELRPETISTILESTFVITLDDVYYAVVRHLYMAAISWRCDRKEGPPEAALGCAGRFQLATNQSTLSDFHVGSANTVIDRGEAIARRLFLTFPALMGQLLTFLTPMASDAFVPGVTPHA